MSAFYVLIVMVISIFFSVGIYNISTNELGRGMVKTFGVIDKCALDRLPPGFENLEHARIEQIDEINTRLQSKLVYFNLIILILSSLLSYFLARKTLRPLEQAMEEQNRFTADASHELRTPLAAMRAETEVALRDKKLSISEAKKLLESNIEETKKLEHLSDVLLRLAKYQNIKVDFKNIMTSDILVEAYEKVESLAKAKNIVFENELKEIEVLGERQSLIELFVILLDNAIKYSDKGKKIEIKTAKVGGKVVVRIKDYGLGIKSSDLPHIFDRFYRADTSRAKTKVNGYGLGLSLAKQIVDLHGADISVKSTIGKGTEFTVSL